MRKALLVLAFAAGATSLAVKPRLALRRPAAASVVAIRGGATPQMSALAAITGAFAMPSVLGATAIAAVPCGLALVRQAYIFSLSYGLAAAAVGGFVLKRSCPVTNGWVFLHAALMLAYGARLFAFLLWRQMGQDAGYGGPNGKLAKMDKTPRSKRAPLVLSIALFYALMISPLIFHAQAGAAAVASAPLGLPIAVLGAGLAASGLALESLADLQKSLYKIRLRKEGAADRQVRPTWEMRISIETPYVAAGSLRARGTTTNSVDRQDHTHATTHICSLCVPRRRCPDVPLSLRLKRESELQACSCVPTPCGKCDSTSVIMMSVLGLPKILESVANPQKSLYKVWLRTVREPSREIRNTSNDSVSTFRAATRTTV